MTNPAQPAATAARHIGLLIFDDVEELDAVGPWEVLSCWALHHPEGGWSVSCISRDGEAIRARRSRPRDPPRSRRRHRAQIPPRAGRKPGIGVVPRTEEGRPRRLGTAH